jgi:DNA-binding protein H-NS
MARANGLDRLSYAELAEMRQRIDGLMVEKQNAERAALREQMTALAHEHGFDLRELLDGRRRGRVGSVAIKYRDPKNPANTWTGRGRTPRWMAAALKGGKARKNDFLIRA